MLGQTQALHEIINACLCKLLTTATFFWHRQEACQQTVLLQFYVHPPQGNCQGFASSAVRAAHLAAPLQLAHNRHQLGRVGRRQRAALLQDGRQLSVGDVPYVQLQKPGAERPGQCLRMHDAC